jgi:hypothetical protein
MCDLIISPKLESVEGAMIGLDDYEEENRALFLGNTHASLIRLMKITKSLKTVDNPARSE